MSGAGTAVFSAVNTSGVNRRSRRPAKSAVSRSAWACSSGISGIDGYRVLRVGADVGEHGVERAEDGLGGEQAPLVAMEADLAADERFLGVERPGRHRHRRVPRLLHAHVLGVGDARRERDRAAADLQVVGDVALRPVRDELGQADLVLVGEPGQVAVVGDARAATASIHSRLR